MALKPAICTQCGANIEVDDSKEAGICKHCGTAFITEKVIANYTNNYTTVNNITNNVTKIINGGKDSDDAEDFFNRGLTNLKLKNNVKAEDNFKKAIELSPEVAKYYFYKYIACGYEINSFVGPDAKSFFALATEKEKQDLGKEYGLDLTDLNTAAYTSCKRACIENKYSYYQLEYLVEGKHIDLESESFAKLCSDYLEKEIEIYNKNKTYKELDSLTALEKSFVKGKNQEVNAKLDELINKIKDIATQAYFKKVGSTIYILNTKYVPDEFKFGGTLKVDDQSINHIVFGYFSAEYKEIILTKNIKSINRLCSDVYKSGARLEDISYSQSEPAIRTDILTIEEDCDEATAFKATENILVSCVVVPASFKKAEFEFKYSTYYGVGHTYLKVLGKNTKVNSFLRKAKYVHGSDKDHMGYVQNGNLYLPTTYDNTCCYYDKYNNEFCKFIEKYEPEALKNFKNGHGGSGSKKPKWWVVLLILGLGAVAVAVGKLLLGL